jgi:hypothetical protein
LHRQGRQGKQMNASRGTFTLRVSSVRHAYRLPLRPLRPWR